MRALMSVCMQLPAYSADTKASGMCNKCTASCLAKGHCGVLFLQIERRVACVSQVVARHAGRAPLPSSQSHMRCIMIMIIDIRICKGTPEVNDCREFFHHSGPGM